MDMGDLEGSLYTGSAGGLLVCQVGSPLETVSSTEMRHGSWGGTL